MLTDGVSYGATAGVTTLAAGANTLIDAPGAIIGLVAGSAPAAASEGSASESQGSARKSFTSRSNLSKEIDEYGALVNVEGNLVRTGTDESRLAHARRHSLQRPPAEGAPDLPSTLPSTPPSTPGYSMMCPRSSTQATCWPARSTRSRWSLTSPSCAAG